jgi:O-antigen/teichoic acid export membrane protein
MRWVFTRFTGLAGLEIAAKALGFLVAALLTRTFGPTGFGAITFAQSIAMHGQVFTTAGLNLFGVKTASQHREQLPAIASTVLVLRLVLAVLVYLALLAACLAIPRFRESAGLLAAFGLLIFTGALMLSWVPQAIHRPWVFGLSQIGIQATFLVLVVPVVLLDRGPALVAAAQVGGELLVAAAVIWWIRRALGGLHRPFPRAEALAFFRESLPIGLARMLRAVALLSDIVILGFLVEEDQVGLYGAGFKFFQLGLALVGMYFIVFFPSLSQHAARSPRELYRALGSSVKIALPLTLVGLALAYVLAPSVLDLAFGDPFGAAAPSLRILLVALLLYVLNMHVRHGLVALGLQRVDVWNVAGSTILHVAFKLALIPAWGIEGAALGHVGGELGLALLGGATLLGALRRFRRSDGESSPPPDATRHP